MSNEKIDKISNILYRQLRNYQSDWNPEYISNQVPRAMEQMEKNYSKAASNRLYQDGKMIFNPMHTVTWAVFFVQIESFIILEWKYL